MKKKPFIDIVLLSFFILWTLASLTGMLVVYWGTIEEWFK